MPPKKTAHIDRGSSTAVTQQGCLDGRTADQWFCRLWKIVATISFAILPEQHETYRIRTVDSKAAETSQKKALPRVCNPVSTFLARAKNKNPEERELSFGLSTLHPLLSWDWWMTISIARGDFSLMSTERFFARGYWEPSMSQCVSKALTYDLADNYTTDREILMGEYVWNISILRGPHVGWKFQCLMLRKQKGSLTWPDKQFSECALVTSCSILWFAAIHTKIRALTRPSKWQISVINPSMKTPIFQYTNVQGYHRLGSIPSGDTPEQTAHRAH